MTDIFASHPYLLFAAMMGGAVASFCCVVVDRAGSGEGLGGRSHCVCGRQLHPWENIPVIGWVAARGRARCCGARIPAWYVVAEIAGTMAWAVAGWFGPVAVVAAATVTAIITTGFALRRVRH